jgi:hypothetical protein
MVCGIYKASWIWKPGDMIEVRSTEWYLLLLEILVITLIRCCTSLLENICSWPLCHLGYQCSWWGYIHRKTHQKPRKHSIMGRCQWKTIFNGSFCFCMPCDQRYRLIISDFFWGHFYMFVQQTSLENEKGISLQSKRHTVVLLISNPKLGLLSCNTNPLWAEISSGLLWIALW